MSATFIETPRFPDFISFWAKGGRGFKTDIAETYGGDEFRTSAWQQGRGEWEIQSAWMLEDQTNNSYNQSVTLKFFHVCMGQKLGFRFKWWWDFTDAMNGGSGTVLMIDSTHYQLTKTYTVGSLSYVQNIVKPVSGTITIAGSGSYTLDTTTGIITIISGSAPTGWTGEYDTPVRFASDLPDLGADESSGAMLNWQQLKVIEIRDFA